MKKMIIKDLKKLPMLLLGFAILAVGNALMKSSNMGMNPWGVFHDGISKVTGMSFGDVIIVVGLIIILLSWITKLVIPGPGTIINMLTIGTIVNLILETFKLQIPDNLAIQLPVLVLGMVLYSIGTAIYISCELGAGPRDGIFVTMTRVLQIPVTYTKPIIEVTVLTIGFLLGGKVGIGTVITVLLTGKCIDIVFSILKYDPKKKNVRKITDYFKK